jgi:hypothetical protein
LKPLRLLPLTFASAAIILLPFALKDLRAAQSQRALTGYLERWDKRAWAEDAELAFAMRTAGSLVADLPRSAEAWMRVGRAAEYRAWSQRHWPDFYRKEMTYAGSVYRTALGLRPSSAAAWMSFARVRFSAGAADRIFEQALIRAIQLAPWEAAVLQEAIPLASRAWDGLSEETRRSVAVGTRNALHDYHIRGLWQDAAKRHGWDSLVEPDIAEPGGRL